MTNKITSIAQLKKEASKPSGLDCSILLGGGALRSSKEIFYSKEKKVFSIFSSIDGCFATYTTKQLNAFTNIIKAMKLGSLIKND